MVSAQEETRALAHDHLGAEHLLLGLLDQDAGVAAEALSEAGVSIEDARREVDRLDRVGTTERRGSLPFDPEAKRALERSLKEAIALGQSYIGTEHLLLGIVDDPKGTASRVLVDLGVDLTDLRRHVLDRLPDHEEALRHHLGWFDRGDDWFGYAAECPTCRRVVIVRVRRWRRFGRRPSAGALARYCDHCRAEL
jgi:ATP-dependent Clp protease ATP-binding subunit ClpA